MMDLAGTVVFCWGSWDFVDDRKKVIESLADKYAKLPIKCFGVNKNGSPKHPLYQRGDVLLENFYQERK